MNKEGKARILAQFAARDADKRSHRFTADAVKPVANEMTPTQEVVAKLLARKRNGNDGVVGGGRCHSGRCGRSFCYGRGGGGS